jgi:hypothetical protein
LTGGLLPGTAGVPLGWQSLPQLLVLLVLVCDRDVELRVVVDAVDVVEVDEVFEVEVDVVVVDGVCVDVIDVVEVAAVVAGESVVVAEEPPVGVVAPDVVVA